MGPVVEPRAVRWYISLPSASQAWRVLPNAQMFPCLTGTKGDQETSSEKLRKARDAYGDPKSAPRPDTSSAADIGNKTCYSIAPSPWSTSALAASPWSSAIAPWRKHPADTSNHQIRKWDKRISKCIASAIGYSRYFAEK